MKKYFFEYDAAGTIHKTVVYDGEHIPEQTAGEGRQLLAIEAAGLPQVDADFLHNARMQPHRYVVVDGEVVARPPE